MKNLFATNLDNSMYPNANPKISSHDCFRKKKKSLTRLQDYTWKLPFPLLIQNTCLWKLDWNRKVNQLQWLHGWQISTKSKRLVPNEEVQPWTAGKRECRQRKTCGSWSVPASRNWKSEDKNLELVSERRICSEQTLSGYWWKVGLWLRI